MRRLDTTTRAVWLVSSAEDVAQMSSMQERRNKNWAMSNRTGTIDRVPVVELLL